MSCTVAVVLINWKRPDEVSKTITRLRAQAHQDIVIYIVNNGDVVALHAELPKTAEFRIRIIEAGGNSGFSGACNLGLAAAREEGIGYLWFLNTDTRIESDCLTELLNEVESHPDCGLFSPVIFNDDVDYPVWVAGGIVDSQSLNFNWVRSLAEAAKFQQENPECLVLPGTALLVRREAFEAIGPMDEELFAYHEDVDFCLRAEQRNIGRRLVFGARIYHCHKLGEPIAPHVGYYTVRNSLLLMKKYGLIIAFLRRAVWEAHGIRRNGQVGSDLKTARALGLVHGLLGRTGELPSASRLPFWIKFFFRI
ncbi:glycosyltransferase family 2 protein [Ideonella sp. DXS22W]|uniref:Glycosyltransferase family 2 protein n=1 Tax=Pseudaquabacterium inlustre TaxID=2984192 RepID=A0ABU9CR10_9BURK